MVGNKVAKVKNPVWPGVMTGGLVDLQAKCADFFLSALNGNGAEVGAGEEVFPSEVESSIAQSS